MKTLNLSIQIVFRGYAQILLQNRISTGIFFFLAIFVTAYEVHKPEIFYYSVTGAILSPTLAWFLGYPRIEIFRGLWGYNAILYSIAISVFLPFSVQNHFLLIVGIAGIVLFTPLLSCIFIRASNTDHPFYSVYMGSLYYNRRSRINSIVSRKQPIYAGACRLCQISHK